MEPRWPELRTADPAASGVTVIIVMMLVSIIPPNKDKQNHVTPCVCLCVFQCTFMMFSSLSTCRHDAHRRSYFWSSLGFFFSSGQPP